ncbi:MAG: ABC transporter ATP-binding protein [Roseiflexaceae bacterium]
MQALELDQITLDYGARRVLFDISLTVTHGQVLVVTGSNGSGKSTLLRVICGLQRQNAGNVWFHVNDQRHDPLHMRHLIGWMAPDLMLYRELTGHENLRFFADVRGMIIGDDEIEALLTEVGLGGRGGDLLATYSSGMTHRLRYAYALLHQPPLLLLDEPSVMLDKTGHDLLERVVMRQRAHGITVIATNDPREQRFADLLMRLEVSV